MEQLVMVVIVVVIAWYFLRRKAAPDVRQVVTQASIPGPGKYAYDVVGESHYQDALAEVCGGKKGESVDLDTDAALFFENDNKYDPQAVRVEIQGLKVGYLSRKDAPGYREQILAMGKGELACRCKAKIVGGWYISNDDQGDFGVRLDLPVKDV
ncbi:hypothetical protein [Castellaniella sp.]|uniref:hypothetical protein n=1 Tax=Castellaniella sp. TaxID=1955812 RepID=UPI003A8E9A5E